MSFQRIRRTTRWVFISVVLLFVLVYAADYVSVRYRIPNNREMFSYVTVQSLYEVRLKNGKIDYSRGDPENQVCVNSLLPQLGYTPCWYLNRHKQKVIQVGTVRHPRSYGTPRMVAFPPEESCTRTNTLRILRLEVCSQEERST